MSEKAVADIFEQKLTVVLQELACLGELVKGDDAVVPITQYQKVCEERDALQKRVDKANAVFKAIQKEFPGAQAIAKKVLAELK